MRRLVTIVILCAGCVLTAGAQSFTQRLQQKTQAGQGTVTVSHDKAIDDLVNGQAASQQDHESQEKQDKPESPAATSARTARRLSRLATPSRLTTLTPQSTYTSILHDGFVA